VEGWEREHCESREECRGRRRGRDGNDLAVGLTGVPISWGMIAGTRRVVNRNLLLVRYSFERIAKSFRRGELQRRRVKGNGRARAETEVRANRVRGATRVLRVGQGACVLGRCEGDSKPAHAKPAYAAPKFSPRGCRPPAGNRRDGMLRCIVQRKYQVRISRLFIMDVSRFVQIVRPVFWLNRHGISEAMRRSAVNAPHFGAVEDRHEWEKLSSPTHR